MSRLDTRDGTQAASASNVLRCLQQAKVSRSQRTKSSTDHDLCMLKPETKVSSGDARWKSFLVSIEDDSVGTVADAVGANLKPLRFSEKSVQQTSKRILTHLLNPLANQRLHVLLRRDHDASLGWIVGVGLVHRSSPASESTVSENLDGSADNTCQS